MSATVDSPAPADVAAAEQLWSCLEAAAARSRAVVLAHLRGTEGPGAYRVRTLEEQEVLYRLASTVVCLRMGQLESVLIRDKNKVTRLVDGLEAADLVRRVTAPDDRRVVMVELTEHGHAALADIGPAWGAGLRDAIAAHLDPDQVATASASLDRLLVTGLATLPTRFGSTTGDDADAFDLPALRAITAPWGRLSPRVGAEHAVLWIRLLRLVALVDEACEQEFRARHGLSRTEAETLRAVYRHPTGAAPVALLADTGLTSGGITRITDRLVTRDLVVRRPHPDDRRSTLLIATSAGRALAGDVDRTRARVLTTALDHGPRNRGARTLIRLMQALDQAGPT